MTNFKNLGLSIAGAGTAFLAIATKALAVPPVADTAVVAATTDSITGLQEAGTANLATLIPLAAVLMISVAVIYFVVKHFRSLAHV